MASQSHGVAESSSKPTPSTSNRNGLHFGAHLGGSATAAVINFPLWKAAAIGQSGFKEAADLFGRMRLIFGPPYKGVAATIFGMTWARAASEYSRPPLALLPSLTKRTQQVM